jgi:hypothetical protein
MAQAAATAVRVASAGALGDTLVDNAVVFIKIDTLLVNQY